MKNDLPQCNCDWELGEACNTCESAPIFCYRCGEQLCNFCRNNCRGDKEHCCDCNGIGE